jgi:hypothetical protein
MLSIKLHNFIDRDKEIVKNLLIIRNFTVKLNKKSVFSNINKFQKFISQINYSIPILQVTIIQIRLNMHN